MRLDWLQGALDGARAANGEPLAWLAVLAIALASPGTRQAQRTLIVGLFVLAALSCMLWAPSETQPAIAAALLAVLGLVMAAGATRIIFATSLAAACGGLAFGLAAGLPLAMPTEAVGSVAAGVVMLALLLMVCAQLHRRWEAHVALRLGPRILGAWTAAIGLLLMALHLWGGGR